MILVALLLHMLTAEPQAMRWTNDGASANKFVLTTSVAQSGSFSILGAGGEALITIGLKDGHVTYGPHYTPDAAARIFWDSVAAMAGKNCEAQPAEKK